MTPSLPRPIPRSLPSAEMLLPALEHAPDIVALYDAEDWLVYCNAAFRALYLRDHTGPIRFADILRLGFAGGFGVKIDCGDIEAFLSDILPRRRSVPHRTLQTDTMDGRWLSISETLLPYGMMLCVGSDITRLKDNERELRRMRDELTAKADALFRSNEELEQFAYVASHDLQEPLRTIGSYVQLVARKPDDPGTADYLSFILGGVRRMQDLIGDLLSYSRVSTEAAPLQPTPLDAVVRTALANLRATIEARGATVRHSPLPRVKADGPQLAQVLQNLVANAIKFCRDRPPEIDITAQRRRDAWEIRVRDNGIGIDARHLERIFVIFQRLHPQEQYPGTGIGLAICKKIVERHGGTIRAESAGAGQGSTFVLTLPAG